MPFMVMKERERQRYETKRRIVALPTSLWKKFHDEEENLQGRNSYSEFNNATFVGEIGLTNEQ